MTGDLKTLARNVAQQAMTYPYKVWGFGEGIALRALWQAADVLDASPDLRRGQERRRERAQPPGAGDRRDQSGRGEAAGHRGLDERISDTEPV